MPSISQVEALTIIRPELNIVLTLAVLCFCLFVLFVTILSFLLFVLRSFFIMFKKKKEKKKKAFEPLWLISFPALCLKECACDPALFSLPWANVAALQNQAHQAACLTLTAARIHTRRGRTGAATEVGIWIDYAFAPFSLCLSLSVSLTSSGQQWWSQRNDQGKHGALAYIINMLSYGGDLHFHRLQESRAPLCPLADVEMVSCASGCVCIMCQSGCVDALCVCVRARIVARNI